MNTDDDAPDCHAIDPFVASQMQKPSLPHKERCPFCIDGTIFLSPDFEKTCLNCEGRGFIVTNKGKS